MDDEEFSCWFISIQGSVISIATEEAAANLAERHPNLIYFFANLVAV